MDVIVLDGALGTLLEQRGHVLREPAWSAGAVRDAPDAVAGVHGEYARAGATVHTAATFRTTPWAVGADAERLTRRAVALARDAVPSDHRVFGSLAPARDCWRPEDSPATAAEEHLAQCRRLAQAGVDGLLVETFANLEEAVLATRAAAATGLPVWTALTPGHDGRLLTPEALALGARRVHDAGSRIVFVNCLPADIALPWVLALAGTGLPFGVYANTGLAGGPLSHGTPDAPRRHAALARRWIEAGAQVVGGCCGTGPEHIAMLVDQLKTDARVG